MRLQDVDPRIPLAAVAVVVWYKLENFLLKVVLALAAGGWLFVQVYDRFMSSDYVKTDAEMKHERAQRQPWAR